MRRSLVLLVGLLLWTGCFAPPRPLEPAPTPDAASRTEAAVSSIHYRAFPTVEALAAYLRPENGPLVSAHRGGPAPTLPENSIEAFEYAMLHTAALLEFDVRRTADGRLVALHDATLDRTTTGSGPVGGRTLAELRRLRLRDLQGRVTTARIPTIEEVFAWAEGRAVLVVDRKRDVPHAEIVAAVRRAEAENRVILITYTREDLDAYLALAPDLVYSVTTTTLEEAEAVLARHAPDRLVGWAGVGGLDPAVAARLREAGVMLQVGTFGEIDRRAQTKGPEAAFRPLLTAGADVLASDRVPLAAQAIHAARRD